MKLRRRSAYGDHPAARDRVIGAAYAGKRTKDLAKRLPEGSIAIIDHQDIDRVAGEMLVAAGVAAVVNAAPSISGRYPNGGPIRLVESGIVVLDRVGVGALDRIVEGEELAIHDNALWRGDEQIASGVQLDLDSIVASMEHARLGIGDELRRFASNTLEYIGHESDAAFEPLRIPELRTELRGRHALVVVRGHDYKTDLATLKSYIKEFRPALIAVDGGADALLEIGLMPEMIFGDFDSLSDRAMHCGAELVAHGYVDGDCPASDLLRDQNLDHVVVSAPGMSEDVAMLLAYESGATLIVAVGTHSTLVEMLDKGRRGMASTFLTRLRLGPVLVDAKGVHRLYESRVRRSDLVLLVLAALTTIVVIMTASDAGRLFTEGLWVDLKDRWRDFVDWIT